MWLLVLEVNLFLAVVDTVIPNIECIHMLLLLPPGGAGVTHSYVFAVEIEAKSTNQQTSTNQQRSAWTNYVNIVESCGLMIRK